MLCSPYELPRRFRAWPLFSEHYVLAVGAAHRLHGRQTVTPTELSRERYCDRRLCEFSAHVERLLRDQGVQLQVVQQSAREDWIQALVAAGFGVAFMPLSIARAAGLACVHTADVPIVRQVQVLAPADMPLTTAQQAVVDSLVAHVWSPGHAVPQP